MNDAQFSIARVLKGFPNFETAYQGQSVKVNPLCFPGELDSNAGKPGYDNSLLKGFQTSLGSKVLLWIPIITWERIADINEIIVIPYEYTLVWRLRNITDYKNKGVPFHLSRETKGANNQFVIPASFTTVGIDNLSQFDQALLEPGPFESLAVPKTKKSSVQLVKQTITIQGGILENKGYVVISESYMPLVKLPDGTTVKGTVQQGIGENVSNKIVSYNIFETDALGDELLIFVNRPVTINGVDYGNWDFSSFNIDSQFSQIYGTNNNTRTQNKDTGIYLMQGVN